MFLNKQNISEIYNELYIINVVNLPKKIILDKKEFSRKKFDSLYIKNREEESREKFPSQNYIITKDYRRKKKIKYSRKLAIFDNLHSYLLMQHRNYTSSKLFVSKLKT